MYVSLDFLAAVVVLLLPTDLDPGRCAEAELLRFSVEVLLPTDPGLSVEGGLLRSSMETKPPPVNGVTEEDLDFSLGVCLLFVRLAVAINSGRVLPCPSAYAN